MMTAPQFKVTKDTVAEWLKELSAPPPERDLARSKAVQAYCSAAAVLSCFDPDTLVAYPPQDSPASAMPELLALAQPHESGSLDSRWRLRSEPRRSALAALGGIEEMRAARAVNRIGNPDLLQRMIDLVLSNSPPDPAPLNRAELAALTVVTEWFEGLLDGLPDSPELRRHLARADLLAPMEKLAGPKGSHFVGRKRELQQLKDYVGILPAGSGIGVVHRFLVARWYSLTERPPMMIQGAGGVGKSTLVAKFIIDHVGADGPQLPFAYFDFDRPGLDPVRPISLLIEAARQLAAQFPELKDRAGRFSDDVRNSLISSDRFEATKSIDSVDTVVASFSDLLAGLPDPTAPILIALDTFEEVQFLGEESIYPVWDLLVRLQQAIARLRIVICGRAELPSRPNAPIKLRDLDIVSARTFVQRHLTVMGRTALDDRTLGMLIQIVGTNPLSLKLAASLVAQEGPAALDNVETRRHFFLKMKAERIQAMLYGRILSHLHGRDGDYGEKLRRLAHPGLVVRRLTPDVIEKVLAAPCGIELSGSLDAQALFDLFRREAALVESDPSDPEAALRQRSDVRRLMLADLDASEAVKAKEIDRNAVQYYAARRHESPVMRAEEIYHRLRLGDDKALLDPLWTEDLRPWLLGAVDEVGPQARLWLSARLGITPDKALLAEADQELWETHAERRVRTYLFSSSPAPEPALAILQERESRRPASPLYLLEAETLRMLDRPQAALAMAKLGLNSLARAPEPALAYAAELERLISLLEESLGNFAAALEAARRAEKLARDSGDAIGLLQAQVAQLRIMRRLGQPASDAAAYEKLLNDVDSSLTPDLQTTLRERPALLRELVAELGSRDAAVLDLGVETLGIELLDARQQREFAEILKQWDRETGGGAGGELAEKFGIRPARNTGADTGWLDFIVNNSGSRLNQVIRRTLIEFRPSAKTSEDLAQIFRTGVDSTISQITRHTRSR